MQKDAVHTMSLKSGQTVARVARKVVLVLLLHHTFWGMHTYIHTYIHIQTDFERIYHTQALNTRIETVLTSIQSLFEELIERMGKLVDDS